MKVKLSNSIIDIRVGTQAICIPDEKIINIIDLEDAYELTIYPSTMEDLKKDYNKIVKVIDTAVDSHNKTINKKQEAKGE